MKQLLLSKWNWLISSLIGLLGFSSCGDKYGPAEYGTPCADFIIRGTVISAESDAPVSNIRVVMQQTNEYDDRVWGVDSVQTDAQGRFAVQWQDFPKVQKFIISCRDVDGVVNGLYYAKDTLVQFSGKDFTGGSGGWYAGKSEQTIDIKLTPKDEE